jgi:hypothetical protein
MAVGVLCLCLWSAGARAGDWPQFRGADRDGRSAEKGLLYVTSGYGKGAVGLAMADDGRSVRQLWEQPRQNPVHGQAVLVDGYVYAASHQKANGRWSCVDFRTGRLAWEDAGVGKGGSVIFADGMLYCYSEDGVMGLVRPSPEKCQIVSTFKVSEGDGPHWAHPVVAGHESEPLPERRPDVKGCIAGPGCESAPLGL